MALPPRPPINPNQPIPNNPFYFPETNYLKGEYSPFVIGSGLSLSVDGVLSATGGGGSLTIAAGTGISATTVGSTVTIANTGIISLSASLPLSVTAGATPNITVAGASTGSPGVIQIATNLETQTGTNTTKAVTPASLQSKVSDSVSTLSSSLIASSSAVKTAYDLANSKVSSVVGTSPVVVNVTDPLNPVISVNNATTTEAGIVQLNDTLTSTSTTQALTANQGSQLKALIDASVPASAFTAVGDILVGLGAGSYAPLSLGSAGQVLTVDLGSPDGVSWTSISTGGIASVTGTAPITIDVTDPSNPVIGVTAATTSAPGVVQLNDTVTSTSTTEAATANAVKTAYDLADSALLSVTGTTPVQVDATDPKNPIISVDAATTTAPGIVQLNNTITSTSITEAATASAVKTAYDAAVASVQGVTGNIPISVDNTDPQNPVVNVAAASTTVSGTVQLNDTVASTSVTQAATANVVKTVYDLANAKVDDVSGVAPISVNNANPKSPIISVTAASTSAAGVVQLNDTVTSTSTTQAATANAVKTAYDLAAGSVQSITVAAPLVDTGSATDSNLSINVATTTTTGVVSVGSNISVSPTGEISVASGTTSVAGVLQLNDTTTSTSITQALTAAQGKALQDQINNLSVTSSLILAGTIDASTGNMVTVTSQGTAAGFVVGSPLVAPAAGNIDYFVIVTTAGTMTPPGGSPQACSQGDWWLSDGTSWLFLNVGFDAPYASTTVPGIIELATDAEVQAGTDSTLAVVPSSLQSKISDSTSTTSSTTIASSTAVKAAYDLADAAIPDSIILAKGNLIVGTGAGTYVALSVGSDDQILIADSTCTSGVRWDAAPATPEATSILSGTVFGYTRSTNNNTTLGHSAGCAIAPAADNNLFVGYQAGCLLQTGDSNTALGSLAFQCNTTGSFNVAIGESALCCNLSCNNVAVGASALRCADGFSNVAVGRNALRGALVSCCNTAVGAFALCLASGAFCNVALGYLAGGGITTGCNNVTIGSNVQVADPAGSCQLAIGPSSANYWIIGDSSLNIKPGAGIIDCADLTGTSGQFLQSTGTGIEWVASPAPSDATPTVAGVLKGCTNNTCENTYLGCNAGLADTALTADSNVAVGSGALCATVAGRCETAVGAYALCSDAGGLFNTAFGYRAGNNITLGAQNVVIGPNTQVPNPAGSDQLVIGNTFDCNWLTGDCNYSIRPARGIVDCTGSCGTAGQMLISNGFNRIIWSTPAFIPCACITAKGALVTGTGASTPVGLSVGTNGQVLTADSACTSGLKWAAIPSVADATPTAAGVVFGTTANSNIGLGCDALLCITGSGFNNVGIGVCANRNVTSGCSNISIGTFAGCAISTGGSNIFMGTRTGQTITTGVGNIGIGNLTMCASGATDSNLVAIGNCAMRNGGVCTVALGAFTALACTTRGVYVGHGASTTSAPAFAVSDIVAIGAFSNAWVTGSNNTAVGSCAMYGGGSSVEEATNNTAIGAFALRGLRANGNFNTAVGFCAGRAITSGAGNVVLGACAINSITTGCQNVVIGPGAAEGTSLSGSRNNTLYVGVGANCWLFGDSNFALQPGNGIVDCAGSCGTAGQVLMSNGSNKVCWGDVASGGVQSITGTAPIAIDITDPANPAISVTAASTTAAGVVQLNDTTSSVSTTEAATANAVKVTYDLANAAQADATQALSDASAAQTDATQALADAAAAQADATQALADAAAAQTDATQALADSAAAQADATQALSDAAGAQATADAAIPCAAIAGKGYLISGTAAETPVALSPGSDGQILAANSGSLEGLAWIDDAGAVAIPCACITGKGAIITGTAASTPVALSVGTDNQVLTADSTCPSGVKWAPATAGAAEPRSIGSVFGCVTDPFASTCYRSVTAIGQNVIGCLSMTSPPTVPAACQSTFIGTCAGLCAFKAVDQVAIGFCAGTGIITSAGGCAVYIGSCAGRGPGGGSGTVGIGYRALDSATGSFCNIAIGYLAMGGSSAQGVENIGVGVLTSASNNSCRNVMLGYCAQVSCNTQNNIAIGYLSCVRGSATATIDNIVIGTCARSGAGSTRNVMIGQCAGRCACNLGNDNVLIGTRSGEALTGINADFNTALGACTLPVSTTGYRNTVVGANATFNLTTGNQNIAVGFGAGICLTTGVCNLLIGNGAGTPLSCASCPVITGNNNIALGHYACVPSTGSNVVVIGSCACASSTSVCNEITLGDANITTLRAAVTSITSLSDARDKTDVTALPVGLDFVKALNPVKFTWEQREPNATKDGTSETGFIAQELQAVEEQFGTGDYTQLVYDSNPERLETSPGKLIPILVKAIQELSERNDALEARLAKLERA